MLTVPIQSFADVLGFYGITHNSPGNPAIGENQFTVDIKDPGGGEVLFTFYNSGPAKSTISEIYFDDGSLLGISSIVEIPVYNNQTKEGVDFTAGDVSINPKNLPGGTNITPVFEVTQYFWAEAENPAPKKGIDPGEVLDIYFKLKDNYSYNDVLLALPMPDDTANGLRIGLHAISMGVTEESESFVNNPVPIPGGIWLLASSLLCIAGLRKRNK